MRENFLLDHLPGRPVWLEEVLLNEGVEQRGSYSLLRKILQDVRSGARIDQEAAFPDQLQRRVLVLRDGAGRYLDQRTAGNSCVIDQVLVGILHQPQVGIQSKGARQWLVHARSSRSAHETGTGRVCID